MVYNNLIKLEFFYYIVQKVFFLLIIDFEI